MGWLDSLVRRFGGQGRGLVRLRDSLTLLQAAIAVIAVAWAQSASLWAVALTVLLATWAMVRPLPEEASPLSQRLWTLGIVIALVGCMRGFQVRGGAASVGQYTTSAVVTSIFLVIIVDSVFTLIFQYWGL